MTETLKVFNQTYKGRNVLVTGHNGFKGSWLCLWLTKMGANVSGLSLAAAESNPHFSQLVTKLKLNVDEYIVDIRDANAVNDVLQKTQPEIVFHLAAQSLVRPSYDDPLATWSTNVMGTANVLEACRKSETVNAIVVITTDKCYENKEWLWGYRENDRLGGHDPYSASKAGVEILAKSYRQSFFSSENNDEKRILLATARAGNVIGDGDWAVDRLIPDAARAIQQNKQMTVRSPNAVRPWQHVLESLAGYLMLGEKLLSNQKTFADAWNFGPSQNSSRTVEAMLMRLKTAWPMLDINISTGDDAPHEAMLLTLDSTKANTILRWRSV